MGSLASMLSALVVTDLGLAVARYKRNGALSAIALIFFVTAYVFALVAGVIYLSSLYTPLYATLILAGASLIIGLAIIAAMAILNARDKRLALEKRRRSQAQTTLAIATGLTLFRRKPLLAAGLAVGIGAVLGFMRKSGGSDGS